MLSIENPQPDPPCPCLFPHLKSGSDHDQRASHKLPLPDLDPSIDHHHHHHRHHHSQPAGFSIRDYVFTARSKDIKKNWPFSLKNLQLCLKHGVKDPLPPFQPLDTIRNRAFQTCTVESSEHQTEIIANVDGEPFDDQKLDNGDQSNHNTASSCRSGNDFPSTLSSVSQSEIESIPASRPSSSSPVEADTLLETSAARPPPPRKADTATKLLSKKCRLIVKFGQNSDRSSTEDIASNCTAISETMASKTCPVCKTFSSSSNTTLNAHIDQCLSAESTPKWKADSKLTRPRIKTRKIKLMTDIYATAQPCTLEELDRRNGTSWAVVSTLPAREVNDFESQPISDEPRNQQVDNAGEVGPVYIDANGTKLRILSKMSTESLPVLKLASKDLGPKKPLKGGKGSQLFSAKKKRRHGKKHLKYLKLAPQSRKYFSYKTHRSPQIPESQEESFKKEELLRPKQIKIGEPGALGQWACSKRTGLVKKLNKQGCTWQHATQNLQVENDQSSSSLHDSVVTRNQVQKLTKVSKNSSLSSENIHMVEKQSYDARICSKKVLSSEKKRAGSPLFGAMTVDNMERSLLPMKRNTNQLAKDSRSVYDNCLRKATDSTKHTPFSISKRTFPTDAVNCSGAPLSASTEPSTTAHPFTSKSLRVPPSRKNGSSAKRSSMVESRSNVVKKHSSSKNFQLDFMSELDEELVPWQSATDHTDNHGEEEVSTNGTSFDAGNVAVVRQESQDKGMRISPEENVPLKSSQLALHCYGEDMGRNTDSSGRADENNLQGKVASPEHVGGTVSHLAKHPEAKFHKLSDHSMSESNVPHSLEEKSGGRLSGDETLIGPKETSFAGEQIYCADEVGNGIIEQTSHMEEELDSDGGQANSFPEVDPIPIPGPPGSFLPSPRDMGSDDFPGNSSLTTSRAQSSHDQLDFIDGDSSESPISVASTILNSTAVRSDLKYSEPLSSVVLSVQEKATSGFSAANVEHSVDIASSALEKGTGTERTFEGERFAVHRISLEKKPFSFKNDDQPCCCQRKERFSQGIPLNYQDSQLLRRRAVASMSMPNSGKQMGLIPNFRPGNLDKRPEIFPLSSCPTPETEKVMLPCMKPLSDPIHFDGSPDNGVKFPGRVACDSPSPSSSNPILRLMGKNLMVVNKEEGASLPHGQAQSSSPNNHPASQYPMSSNVSSGNLANQDIHSFSHMAPQGSLIFGQNSHDAVGQYFDVRNGFRNHTGLGAPETPGQFPMDMFLNRHLDGKFAAAPLEPYKCGDDYNFSCGQSRSKNRLSAASAYNVEKVITTLDCKQRNPDSAASIKEIIVIDDNDSEPSLTGSVMKYSDQSLRRRQMVSCDTSILPMHSYNSTLISPFSTYQPREAPLVAESSMAKNTNFHSITPRRANASPVRWGCTSEGATVLHRGPFMATPSSTNNLRSPLYYSPSMS